MKVVGNQFDILLHSPMRHKLVLEDLVGDFIVTKRKALLFYPHTVSDARGPPSQNAHDGFELFSLHILVDSQAIKIGI